MKLKRDEFYPPRRAVVVRLRASRRVASYLHLRRRLTFAGAFGFLSVVSSRSPTKIDENHIEEVFMV